MEILNCERKSGQPNGHATVVASFDGGPTARFVPTYHTRPSSQSGSATIGRSVGDPASAMFLDEESPPAREDERSVRFMRPELGGEA